MEVPNADTEEELKELVVDTRRNIMFLNPWEKLHWKLYWLLQYHWRNSFISYLNQSLISSSDCMKELDRFTFEIKAHVGLQKRVWMCYASKFRVIRILHEADLDCFDKGQPQNFYKRWLIDEIINFYKLWM